MLAGTGQWLKSMAINRTKTGYQLGKLKKTINANECMTVGRYDALKDQEDKPTDLHSS